MSEYGRNGMKQTTPVLRRGGMTAAELKAARLALGLTQAELAGVLGYADKGRVSELERGLKPVSRMAARLVRAYLAGYRPADWDSIVGAAR